MISCRTLSHLCLFASLASLLAAGYLYFRAAAEGPGLVVQEPDRVFKDLVPGRTYDVAFQVQNRTGASLRVVGGPCST